MCGIAALIGGSGHDSLELIRAMTSVVSYRGPDDEGAVLFAHADGAPHVFGGKDTPDACYRADLPYAPRNSAVTTSVRAALALGHRRLSIVDVTPSGHQPMCSGDQRYWITYNGEVYNHIELRRELELLGHHFHSHSDTEVLLAAYREWGNECLHRLNGMFAFVLFDCKEKTLFAARDRFGVKPLYYWISPEGRIALASEIKQFTVLPGWRARLNGQRAYDFLNWSLTDHTHETLFAGVYQLRNGEALDLALDDLPKYLHADGGRLLTRKWYALRPQPFTSDFSMAARKFRELLEDSVRLRLRSDVPVGSCLSGGLDSSAIVCEMNHLLKAAGGQALQKTFSACSKVKRFDERDFIEEVVRHTDISAHYIYPDLEDLFSDLDRLTWHQDEPFGSTSIYAQWHVFKLAAENGIKVMLDGQGADEQLAGYHSYFAPRMAHLFKTLQWFLLAKEVRACEQLHGYSKGWAVKQVVNALLPEILRQPLRRLAGKPSTSSQWFDMKALGADSIDPFVAAGQIKSQSLSQLSLAQLMRTNVQMLLHWEDRNSMAHSVESRVPFLDYRLVEFVVGLPDDFKLTGGITKRVLREGLRGLLPEKIRTRIDKIGFATPEEVWLREQDPDAFRTALREAMAISNGIVGKQASGLLEDMIAGRKPFSFLIWRIISFGAWLRIFKVETGPAKA